MSAVNNKTSRRGFLKSVAAFTAAAGLAATGGLWVAPSMILPDVPVEDLGEDELLREHLVLSMSRTIPHPGAGMLCGRYRCVRTVAMWFTGPGWQYDAEAACVSVRADSVPEVANQKMVVMFTRGDLLCLGCGQTNTALTKQLFDARMVDTNEKALALIRDFVHSIRLIGRRRAPALYA